MATERAISKADLESIERNYTIPDPDEVRELLARWPHVVAALVDAPTHIREAFGGRLRGLVLEKVPDYDEGEDLLSTTALVKATAHEAFELQACLNDWWLTQSVEVRLAMALGVAPI